MPLDFSKLSSDNSADTIVVPSGIFRALPSKNPKYAYLRDVQSEVFERWSLRKTDRDVVIKMNTGSGKTLVGILLLKSCINEGNYPAFYVTPDVYLTRQVIKEAGDLGIITTDNPKSIDVLSGKAICVINICKLVNGLSVFGVSPKNSQIPINSVVIDDVHACLSAAEAQFTLTIDSAVNTEEYKQIFTLFKEVFSQQSEIGVLEIESGDPTRDMLVPYWAWINNQKSVIRILHKMKDSKQMKFVWPLIKEQLFLCRCVFGGEKIEISPRCIPINSIPSFVEAKRRVYMSATLTDDNILVSNFNVNSDAVEKPITPKIANDIGDRMILIPQELSPNITDDEIKKFLSNKSQKHNVVIIVPSHYRANYWSDVSTMTLTADNLYKGVEKLKDNKHIGLVVMVNKYDGIDLSDDACRILVIDGLPDVRKKIDKIEQAMLIDSDILLSQRIQRIEQGMGRGIRANDDHCVVFLMGKSLVRDIYSLNAIRFFSPATKTQMDLSAKVAEQIRGKNLSEIDEIINYCLNKDPQWLKVSKGALANLKYADQGKVDLITLKQRVAFDYAQIKQFNEAILQIQEAVNVTTENKTKGWLKLQLAEYTHYLSPEKSQEILKSALEDNRQVLKPLEGITYEKLASGIVDQAQQAFNCLKKYSENTNKIILHLNGIIDELCFLPESHKKFELAMERLAMAIGFTGQRPEMELGKGPDVLWGIGGLKYFIISCKNEATTEEISKYDCNQLSGDMYWFSEKYDKSCEGIPVIIHPSHIVGYQASPNSEMRVVNKTKLDLLKEAIRSFGKNIASSKGKFNIENIKCSLEQNSLTAGKFIDTFTMKYKLAIKK